MVQNVTLAKGQLISEWLHKFILKLTELYKTFVNYLFYLSTVCRCQNNDKETRYLSNLLQAYKIFAQ